MGSRQLLGICALALVLASFVPTSARANGRSALVLSGTVPTVFDTEIRFDLGRWVVDNVSTPGIAVKIDVLPPIDEDGMTTIIATAP